MIAGKWEFASTVLIATLLGIPAIAFSQDATHFQPVEALSVGDLTRPYRSIAFGTVVLDVLISEKGEVKDIQVRRAIASVTDVAIQAVKTWTFQPAEADGKAVGSRITVAVTFNPQVVSLPPVALTPLIHEGDEVRIQSAFQPPEVTHATFPMVWTSSVGAVVLEVTVDETGKGEETKVLRELAPYTATAVRTVDEWRFMPATLNGKPMKAKVILAFVFPPPPPLR
jgi:TonB family protein